MDQANQRQDPLHLAALEVADEVPGETRWRGPPFSPRWSWRRFSPTSSTPASASFHLARIDVLRRRQIRPPGRSARAPARRWRAPRPGRCRGTAQASAIQTRPPWRPVRPRSRRWEKNSSGSQLVHSPAASISTTPARSSRRVATASRSSILPVAIPSPRSANRLQDRLVDLVAAAADPRADRRRGGADRLDATGDDPRREPAPAAVQHRDATLSGQRHRQAVGDLDQRRQPRVGGRLPVCRRAGCPPT